MKNLGRDVQSLIPASAVTLLKFLFFGDVTIDECKYHIESNK